MRTVPRPTRRLAAIMLLVALLCGLAVTPVPARQDPPIAPTPRPAGLAQPDLALPEAPAPRLSLAPQRRALA
ncbi:MAG TPA: hypothetical protein VKE74_19380, partial [Gemmataceae bacterium]|nr:hypothetical protein [Gemmataceae bacterium]